MQIIAISIFYRQMCPVPASGLMTYAATPFLPCPDHMVDSIVIQSPEAMEFSLKASKAIFKLAKKQRGTLLDLRCEV
jgi:hypothetical protein